MVDDMAGYFTPNGIRLTSANTSCNDSDKKILIITSVY